MRVRCLSILYTIQSFLNLYLHLCTMHSHRLMQTCRYNVCLLFVTPIERPTIHMSSATCGAGFAHFKVSFLNGDFTFRLVYLKIPNINPIHVLIEQNLLQAMVKDFFF